MPYFINHVIRSFIKPIWFISFIWSTKLRREKGVKKIREKGDENLGDMGPIK